MKRTLLVWLLSIAIAAPLFAQNRSPEVAFWQHTLRETPAVRALEALADAGKPAWPEIRTAHWIEKLPAADRANYEARLELAKGLLATSKEGFRLDGPSSLTELDKETNRYVAAAKRLEGAEGYTNRVLADCFYQLALFRLSGWLIAHPEAFDEVARRVESVAVPKPDVASVLHRYKVEDPELDGMKLDIAAVDPKQPLSEQLKQAGLDQGSAIAWATRPQDGDTKALLEHPSLVQLLARLATTDGDRRCVLGMAEYLRRGGKLDDASLNDFGKFQQVMGKDVYRYGSAWLSQKFIDGGTFMRIRDRHANQSPRTAEVRASWAARVFD